MDFKNLKAKKIEAFYKPAEEVKVKKVEIDKALAKERYKAPGKFLHDKTSK